MTTTRPEFDDTMTQKLSGMVIDHIRPLTYVTGPIDSYAVASTEEFRKLHEELLAHLKQIQELHIPVEEAKQALDKSLSAEVSKLVEELRQEERKTRLTGTMGLLATIVAAIAGLAASLNVTVGIAGIGAAISLAGYVAKMAADVKAKKEAQSFLQTLLQLKKQTP